MSSRPRDPNQLGKLIVDLATGEAHRAGPHRWKRPSRSLSRTQGDSRGEKHEPLG